MKKSDGTSPNVFTLGNSSSSSRLSSNNNRNEYFAARRNLMQDLLSKNFPTKALIVHCVGLALASILAIVIQTLQMVYQVSYYFVGSGYWVSVINVILIVLAFFLC